MNPSSHPADLLELFLSGDLPPHTARWFRDGQPLGPDFAITEAALRPLTEVQLSFQKLFERYTRPLVDPDLLLALGRILYDTFFAQVQSQWRASTGPGVQHPGWGGLGRANGRADQNIGIDNDRIHGWRRRTS